MPQELWFERLDFCVLAIRVRVSVAGTPFGRCLRGRIVAPPGLSGAVWGESARARIDARWSDFVMDGVEVPAYLVGSHDLRDGGPRQVDGLGAGLIRFFAAGAS